MTSRDGLLLWVLGGAGILFLYAAWSKQHPADVLGKTLGTTAPAAAPATTGAAVGAVAVSLPAPPVFKSRLGPDVPVPYDRTPNLYIPGTWNA